MLPIVWLGFKNIDWFLLANIDINKIDTGRTLAIKLLH